MPCIACAVALVVLQLCFEVVEVVLGEDGGGLSLRTSKLMEAWRVHKGAVQRSLPGWVPGPGGYPVGCPLASATWGLEVARGAVFMAMQVVLSQQSVVSLSVANGVAHAVAYSIAHELTHDVTNVVARAVAHACCDIYCQCDVACAIAHETIYGVTNVVAHAVAHAC